MQLELRPSHTRLYPLMPIPLVADEYGTLDVMRIDGDRGESFSSRGSRTTGGRMLRHDEVASRSVLIVAYAFVVVGAIFTGCGKTRYSSPDLTTAQAAKLIAGAAEFKGLGHLVAVARTSREGDSLAECCYYAYFSFRNIDAPAGSQAIQGSAQFRYHGGAWHLFEFDYGCPGFRCKTAWVEDDSVDRKWY